MQAFHVVVTGPDAIGMGWISNIIEVANLGGRLKPGTIPSMRFPHSVSMEVFADVPPTPRPGIRVFGQDGKEITPDMVFVAPQPTVAATFSMDEDDGTETPENLVKEIPESTVDAGKIEDVLKVDEVKPEEEKKETAKVYSLEELTAMKWADVQTIAREVGVTGRDRDKVTKEYLEKVAVSE